MVRDTHTTTHSPKELIRMFVDETSGEVYNQGRLSTVPTENGVQLVAYGNEVLAEAEGRDITIYTGHHGTVSQTVTNYIKTLGSVLSTETETRSVTAANNEAPTLGIGARASRSAQYIDNYVGDLLRSRDFSDVEKDAKDQVNNALIRRMDQLFN